MAEKRLRQARNEVLCESASLTLTTCADAQFENRIHRTRLNT